MGDIISYISYFWDLHSDLHNHINIDSLSSLYFKFWAELQCIDFTIMSVFKKKKFWTSLVIIPSFGAVKILRFSTSFLVGQRI